MQKNGFLGFLAIVFAVNCLFAQKKVIDHTCYKDWKRIGDIQLSENGQFSVYSLRPLLGDGFLYVVNNETGKKDSIARGIEPQIAGNSSFVAFRIQAGYDTLRKAELAKIPKDKWPKDSLGVWFFANDSLVKFPKLKEFKVASEGGVFAFTSTTNDWLTGYLSTKERKREIRIEKKKGVWKSDGKLLSIWNQGAKKPICYRHITGFDLSKNGGLIAMTEQQKFKKDSIRLAVYDLSTNQLWKSDKRYVEINGMNFGQSPTKLTGLLTTDTAEVKRWNLWYWDNNQMTVVVDTTERFETNRVISSNYKPRLLSDDIIYFGVWNMPEKPVKDTLLESEKVKLDLWHWKDDRLQPQQLIELKRDQNQTNLYSYSIGLKKTVQLGRDSLMMNATAKGNQPALLASSDKPYRFETWNTPSPANYYRISTVDGSITPLRSRTFFDVSLSPSGNYFAFWNEKTNNYYMQTVDNPTEICMTCEVKDNLIEDVNGMPEMAGPRGIIGWTQGEKGLLIQAEKAIYFFDVTTQKTVPIASDLLQSTTDTNYRYTLQNLAPDSTLFYPSNCILTRWHGKTRLMSFYRLEGSFPSVSAQFVDGGDFDYIGFKKAKNNQRITFQRHSNSDYPDLFTTTSNGKVVQLSKANPQQVLYNWSTVELISWTSYDGIPLEGLIYKPENFDTNKSYPLLVYYYEMYADDIHNHYAPKPTASIIYPTEYASAGYVVFIPNIRYKAGFPANGAYDCIMSGTDAVLRKYGNIDPKRLGLQGQSWGGYQTAQLITMTDRYAAAMAGAPVGNMISAYGGIRWGTGISRQFQYEHNQSRIGKTIWEAPERYIENSPVFHLTAVKTPLLIMHNDQDGAVPWYQGIELYTGLRRLQKPVWLLNYNGDDHNLTKLPNKFDLSIRMRQFFDYYLLGAPMPYWLQQGIPAIEKGKQLHYELIEND
jgi:dienelactone hydrolase